MVAIIDSNLTTFIAGIVLYSYGSGSIRGFALTLMIGILTSLGTAVVSCLKLCLKLILKKMTRT